MRAINKPAEAVWSDTDDAPDLSTPKWKAKLAKAPVKCGSPKRRQAK